MLEPIIAWLKDIWRELWPLQTVDAWEEGVMLRYGKFHKMVTPGLWRKWPWVDNIITTPIATTTMDLPAQSITTFDGKAVTVTAIVKYKVTDSKIFLLEVMDTRDALADTTMGIIARLILDSTWEELRGDQINNEITKKARIQAKKYGIEIEQVTLKDIIQAISLRHFNGGLSELLT